MYHYFWKHPYMIRMLYLLYMGAITKTSGYIFQPFHHGAHGVIRCTTAIWSPVVFCLPPSCLMRSSRPHVLQKCWRKCVNFQYFPRNHRENHNHSSQKLSQECFFGSFWQVEPYYENNLVTSFLTQVRPAYEMLRLNSKRTPSLI